jgi:hypothetical protein
MYLHLLDSSRDCALANKSEDVLLSSKGIPVAWWSNAAPRKGLNYLPEAGIWLTHTQLYLTPASAQQYIANVQAGSHSAATDGATAAAGGGHIGAQAGELPSSFTWDLHKAVEAAHVAMWEMPVVHKVAAPAGGKGAGAGDEAQGQAGYLVDVRTEEVVKLLMRKKLSVGGVVLEFKRGSDRSVPAGKVQ